MRIIILLALITLQLAATARYRSRYYQYDTSLDPSINVQKIRSYEPTRETYRVQDYRNRNTYDVYIPRSPRKVRAPRRDLEQDLYDLGGDYIYE